MNDPLMDLIAGSGAVSPDPLLSIEDRVEHKFADSDGVKIHYAALGSGPLVIMMHGFPDHWLTWRHQIDALSKHRCAATTGATSPRASRIIRCASWSAIARP